MMIVMLVTCALVTPATSAAEDPEPLATVRHYSREPAPQWMMTVRRTAAGEVSAVASWIVGEVAGGTDEPVEGRTHKLTTRTCTALAWIAGDLENYLLRPWTIDAPPPEEPADRLFVLEIPGRDPVDLDALPEEHALVRWATSSWDALSACAGANHP